MSSSNVTWGIEVGANSVKAIKLSREGDAVKLLDYANIAHKTPLTAPDVNVAEVVQFSLQQLLQTKDLSESHVVASVAGNRAFARFANLPPIDPSKIGQIVSYEAVQQIPFPLDEVEWDYQVFQKEDMPDVKVGIFAITKDVVREVLGDFRAMGIQIDALTTSSVAAFNAFAYDMPADEVDGTVFVDIGASSTDVIIVEDGLPWLRTFPIGGHHFTDVIAKQFKVSYKRAEKEKVSLATSSQAKRIFQALRGIMIDFAQEVKLSIQYYRTQYPGAELNRIVGVGSTFRLPNFTKYLSKQLPLAVTRLQGFNKIEAEDRRQADFAAGGLSFATAYGLALQGVGLDVVSANILPREEMVRRMWQKKNPWFIATAASLGVATIAAYAFTPSLESAAKEVESTAEANAQAQMNVSAVEALAALPDPRREIAAAEIYQENRSVYPSLSLDIAKVVSMIAQESNGKYHIVEAGTVYMPPLTQNPITDGFSAVFFEGLEPSVAGSGDGTVLDAPRVRVQISGVVQGSGLQVTQMVEGGNLSPVYNLLQQISSDKASGLPYQIDIDSYKFEVETERATAGHGSRNPRPVIRRQFNGGASSVRTNAFDLEGLLPARDVSDEEGRQKQSFTISWEVELLAPEEARAAVLLASEETEEGDNQ